MLPGVVLPEGGIPALGEFKKGDTRAIVIHGTKYEFQVPRLFPHRFCSVPVAVGYMDLGAMALNRQGKMEGQGMQVLHFWRDQLWYYVHSFACSFIHSFIQPDVVTNAVRCCFFAHTYH
jgi:hypothetical protein